MFFKVQFIILILSVLLYGSIAISKFTAKFGVPTLLGFLGLGLIFGNGGEYDFYYDYPEFTLYIGQIAMCIILFTGGLDTDIKRIKPVIKEGLILSTLGVIITAFIVAFFIQFFTHFSFVQSLLLGAIISSTDAAAVFSILESQNLKINPKIISTIELESGTNDPMAYFLTISLTQFILTKYFSVFGFAINLFYNLSLGLLIGVGMGWFTIWSLKMLKLKIGLSPVLIIALILFAFSFSELLGANSLLAVYIMGIILGNYKMNTAYISNFFEGVAWLMEIILFLTLGLQVFIQELPPVILCGLGISACLILVARPLSIFISLVFFNFNLNEKIFIAWVGLRGASPIVFALYPVLYQVPDAKQMFNITFFVVLTSIFAQGSFIKSISKKLKIQ